MSAPQNSAAGGGDANQQIQAELNKLLVRSATDQDFRKKLLTTPREALGEFYGKEIPTTVDVRFIENTADATFVLPDAIDPAAELSENELEAVAGGLSPLASILSIIASVIYLTHEVKKIGDDDAWFS